MVPARLYQAVRPLSLPVSSVLVRKSENAEAPPPAASLGSTGPPDEVSPLIKRLRRREAR